jgi:hypothetical protein
MSPKIFKIELLIENFTEGGKRNEFQNNVRLVCLYIILYIFFYIYIFFNELGPTLAKFSGSLLNMKIFIKKSFEQRFIVQFG